MLCYYVYDSKVAFVSCVIMNAAVARTAACAWRAEVSRRCAVLLQHLMSGMRHGNKREWSSRNIDPWPAFISLYVFACRYGTNKWWKIAQRGKSLQTTLS